MGTQRRTTECHRHLRVIAGRPVVTEHHQHSSILSSEFFVGFAVALGFTTSAILVLVAVYLVVVALFSLA